MRPGSESSCGSASGSPSTMIRSASLPSVTVPMCSSRSSASAAVLVAATRAWAGVSPWCTIRWISRPAARLMSLPSAILTPACRAARMLAAPSCEVVLRQFGQHRRHPGIGVRRGRVEGLPRAGRRVDGLPQAGHPVVARQRGHQDLARGGHRLQQVRPPVQVHAMLDGVHAVPDRRRAAVQALGVRGHPVAHPVRLVGDRGQFRLGELERLWVLELVGAGAGRHHLDEVRAGPDLLPDRPPDVIGAIGLPVHVAVETPARRRRRDDLAAGQKPGTAERAVAHGLPGRLRHQPLRPADPDGGHAEAQIVTEFGLQEVRRDPRQRLLGALRGLAVHGPTRGCARRSAPA